MTSGVESPESRLSGREGERENAQQGVGCPICGHTGLAPVLHLDQVPALCNAFWPTAEAARTAPRGSVDLLACPACGLLHNAAFDGALATYSPAYDNSIHFSPVFQEYVEALARRLVDRYQLHDKRIVEIGCGSGAFLQALCDLGGNRGVGYDPSYDPARGGPVRAGVEIHSEVFPPTGLSADLVACRHVLEHVEDPRAMLSSLRESIGDQPDVAVYFEVPDLTFMLREAAIWDVIHEHRSYFAESTMRWLFESTGFHLVGTGISLDGQYLWIEARPGSVTTNPPNSGQELAEFSQAFGKSFVTTVDAWRARLNDFGPESVAVWGAGAKGVMFLNLVDPQAHIRQVIDINPHKAGRYVPGTAQRVEGPASLAGHPPRHVLVMNPAYRQEVEQVLDDLEISADVLTP